MTPVSPNGKSHIDFCYPARPEIMTLAFQGWMCHCLRTEISISMDQVGSEVNLWI